MKMHTVSHSVILQCIHNGKKHCIPCTSSHVHLWSCGDLYLCTQTCSSLHVSTMKPTPIFVHLLHHLCSNHIWLCSLPPKKHSIEYATFVSANYTSTRLIVRVSVDLDLPRNGMTTFTRAQLFQTTAVTCNCLQIWCTRALIYSSTFL